MAFLVLVHHLVMISLPIPVVGGSQRVGEVLCMLELVALNVISGYYSCYLCSSRKFFLIFILRLSHFHYTFFSPDTGSHVSQTGIELSAL